MRITIDTEKDSPEMVRRAIELLELTLGTTVGNQFSRNEHSNPFQQNSASSSFQQANFSSSTYEQKPRRLKPKDILRQQAAQQSQQEQNSFSLFDNETPSSQPSTESSQQDVFSLFDEPEIKEIQPASSQGAEIPHGQDLVDMFSHELPSSASRDIEEESKQLIEDISHRKDKKPLSEFHELEKY